MTFLIFIGAWKLYQEGLESELFLALICLVINEKENVKKFWNNFLVISIHRTTYKYLVLACIFPIRSQSSQQASHMEAKVRNM